MSSKHKIRAYLDLWTRYLQVWNYFWRRRAQITPAYLKPDEAEFLPAALSLQGEPVSPAGRWTARLLIAMLTVVFAWAWLGRVDIIVIGQGKITLAERTKSIAAVDVSTVRALHVQDGMEVRSGQLLIELDSRVNDIERDKQQVDLQISLMQAARATAMLESLSSGKAPRLARRQDIAIERWNEAENFLQDQWKDYVARRERLFSELRRHEQMLPLATKRAADYAKLAENGDVSKHAWIEKEQQRLETMALLNDARLQLAALTTELKRTTQESLHEAKRFIATTEHEIRRASAQGDTKRLVAPVGGTVQQLTVHTVGSAVPAAQPLMQIVPKNGLVELLAYFDNKDIGFLKVGQSAAVKIDAFEYTKYGTIRAKVKHISPDAIFDEKKGWVYALTIALEQNTIEINGQQLPLTAGMSGTIEVKTGDRRVVDYLLSPLILHVNESLRER